MSDPNNPKNEFSLPPAENKQQLAYQQIKRDILNNTYPEGTMLVERKLCDIYHVSRSPIRNALQQLTHEGLLTFIPGKGTVVSSFSTEDILEVYDLIELMQNYAVSACISRHSSLLPGSLELALQHMETALREKDLFSFTRWDQKFHELLISCSGNKRLLTVYEQLDTQQMLFISTILDDTDLAARSLSEHKAIYEAICAEDISLARERLHEHYQHIKQYYIDKLLSRIHI